MREIWKPIPGWKYYDVSSFGRVRSAARMFIAGKGAKQTKPATYLKRTVTKRGYLQVCLFESGQKSQCKLVHRLVAEAFLDKPKGAKVVNHLDGNTKNNIVSNLEWCTQLDNILHAWKRARGNHHSQWAGALEALAFLGG